MPKKIAFIFPGQGAQAIGMGKDLYENSEVGKARFDEACDVLGFDLKVPCFQGPEEALKKTAVTQPALFVVGAIACDWLKAKGVQPSLAAGHSLGEYTALYAAGAFDFATGLNLVKVRSEAMNEASEATTGIMAAIIGLQVEQVAQLCDEAKAHGVVGLANINDPTQIVVSGEPDAVSAVLEAAKTAGAKRAIQLVVHGAFHSPLMGSATVPMNRALTEANISAPTAKFAANTLGALTADPEEIRTQLGAQITGCVRWVDCAKALIEAGADQLVELGGGKVLSGMMRRIDRSVPCTSAGDVASLEKALETLTAEAE